MLGIILTVLKVIGIILLLILGLVLVLFLTVLFVPVRYKSNGDFEKLEDSFACNVSANISWLLHIVSVNFILKNNNTDFKIKIFGIDILSKKNGEKEKAQTKIAKKQKDKKQVKQSKNIEQVKKNSDTPIDDVVNQNTVNQNTENHVKEYGRISQNDLSKKQSKDEYKEKKSDIQSKKTGQTSDKKNVFEKIKNICDKIRNVNSVKNSFIAYLKRDESKKAIKEIKNIILKVLKHILPGKLKARVRFGFEDPATTGDVLAVASVFYGIYGNKLNLEPEFEKEILEGEYSLKGRIRIFNLLIVAWKIYRNKWIKDFISFSKKSVQEL